MRTYAAFLLLAASAAAQERPLLTNDKAFELYGRVVDLMESTTAAVPGLARSGAPMMEDARQSLATIRQSPNAQDSTLHHSFLRSLRAYLSLADAVPKPFPFPEEGRRQFAELRDAVVRVESHFQALLDLKERQLRNPDRDNLARYADQNAKVGPPDPSKPRVVFLGDSITDFWRLNEYFPERDFINRGISGQVTAQMLGRMMADVVAHKPAVLVVLGGTNDIARGVPIEVIGNNLSMIADVAEAHKIKAIFASVLPVHDYHKAKNPDWEVTRRRPMSSVRALNGRIQGMCQRRNIQYLDYFTDMVDSAGFLKEDLADDGLHPNTSGYRTMAPLVLEAIDKAVTPEPQKKRRRFPF